MSSQNTSHAKNVSRFDSAQAEFSLRYGLIIQSSTLFKCHIELMSDKLKEKSQSFKQSKLMTSSSCYEHGKESNERR